jgi:GNAT superfamily N-acetyltransferase
VPHPRVRPATLLDLPSWLALAREVEPLFGPMPDIDEHIRRGIARGTALVVETPDGSFAGAALLSRDTAPHQIHWLAVSEHARRRGCGSALLRAILARWHDGRSVEVITFGPDLPGGNPARRLYARHGFTMAGPDEPGPDGGSRERWVRIPFPKPPH